MSLQAASGHGSIHLVSGERRTMPVADSTALAYSTSYHRTRLFVVLIICCGLLVVTIEPRLRLAPVFNTPTEGLYRGLPISEMWATRLPEQAWFSSPQCRHHVTRFTRDHCLPLVYLASFPRSGNTWIRYLLEASTGLFTSSGGPNYRQYRNAFNPNIKLTDDRIWKVAKPGTSELVNLGYLGEHVPWTQGISVAQKTHSWPQPWNMTEADSISKPLSPFPEGAGRRAVLIIRDPFKSFISLTKYGETKSVLNDENMTELFRGEKWEGFVIAYAQIWYDLNARWIESTNETHVISYERLTQDPIGELTKLLHFIDIEPDPHRIECVRRQLEGKAHNRHHGVIPDHQTYPLLLRAALWSHIHQLNWLLKDRGYRPLPLHRYSFAEEFGDIHIEA